MRKLYTIKSIAVCALALAANVAVGQNLKVTSHGNPVANGDVVEVACEFMDYSVPGYEYYSYSWDPHLEAAALTGEERLSVTLTSINDTEDFQLCWPSQCNILPPGESLSSQGNITTEPVDLGIHKNLVYYNKVEAPFGGEVKVKLEANEEVIEFTVKCLMLDDNAVGENLSDLNQKATYFTLEGIQIEHPTKGMYIVKNGAKAKLIYKK